MREIRMSGTNEEGELKKGIKFILENQEYPNRKGESITHIQVKDNILTGFNLPNSDYFNSKEEYTKHKLPIPVSIETFSEMASGWFKTCKIPEDVYEPDSDGSVYEGFILLYGKNWGVLDWLSDFGTDKHWKENNTDLELGNLYSIIIIKNYQIYGK